MGRPIGAHVSGPLQPFVRGFLLELIELSYGWTVQVSRLRLMAELGVWMASRELEAGALTLPRIAEFVEGARAEHPGQPWCSPASERQLADYLRRVGLVSEPEPVVVSDPVEVLVERFVEYLVRERGLGDRSHTVWEYKRTARLFLGGRLESDGGGLDGTTAGDVTGFVLAECRHRSRRMSVGLVSNLRGLLRFLFLEGLMPADLSAAVPKVASWRCASLPRALRGEHVARLLASCDRTTAVGRRDFAILVMLSRLGVRACEVARLRLADIDWRAGELIVRGKQNRDERLPFPTDVGDALVDYLRHGASGVERPARVPDGACAVQAADRRRRCHRAGGAVCLPAVRA